MSDFDTPEPYDYAADESWAHQEREAYAREAVTSAAAVAAEVDALARRAVERLVARCRDYDRRKLLSIAAGGGPRSQADYEVVYCPFCNCNKSGDARQPNYVTEACDDAGCLCHNEDL